MTFILFCAFFLFGCKGLAYYYNYGGMKSVKDLQKEANEFYSKETPEQRILRKKNIDFCNAFVKKYEGLEKDLMYDNCMKERGSPMP